MQQTVIRTVFTVALVGGLSLVTRAGNPVPPTPAAPVLPSVPAPVPPVGHLVRFQNLLPSSVGPRDGWGMLVNTVSTEGPAWTNTQPAGQPVAQPEVKELPETGPELNLGQCIAVAVERSPRLKAAAASMAASENGYRSLMKFGTVGTWISPDLDIRKQQSQRGLGAAAGDYQKERNEVVYDVTRLYYTAVYAKQQEAIAADVVDYLDTMGKLIRKILDETTDPKLLGGLNEGKYLTVRLGLIQAQELRTKARIGQQQALAALRQVMNVEEKCFPFRLKDAELPLMDQKAEITKEKVVELALCRRPELALAAAGVDVFRLEVYAQGKIPFRRVVPTFASGADIHSKDIPQAVRTAKEYRPGGIIPEMPTQLVGSKFDRVRHALDYSQRADAIYEDAVSLVTLEAENGFFEFLLTAESLQLAVQKFRNGKELQKRTLDMAESVKEKDLLVQGYVVATRAQSDYVEAVYNYLLSLAALERITAGGICPAFPGR
jgi:outer membrane protein TolC